MENEFLRNSWNSRLSTTDFINQIHEKFDEKSILILISLLENICSFETQSSLFIEYFGSIVNEFLVLSLGNVDFFNETQVNSYFNLFTYYNGELFTKCQIGHKEDAHASLNAFRICLIQNQKINLPILTKLFRLTNFLVLLASSRSLDTDYYIFVKKLYNEISPFEKYPLPYPLLMKSFLRAFTDTRSSIIKVSIIDLNDYLSFSSLFLHIFVLYDFFPNILDRKSYINLFTILLDDFYENSHVLQGYAIHKILQILCEPANGEITKQDLQDIIDSDTYQQAGLEIPFSHDLDALYNYLFVPQKKFDDDHFVSNFLMTPSLCFHFTDMLIEKIPTGSCAFYKDITESVDAYTCLFSERKGDFLLETLIGHLRTIRDSKYYESVFSYFCSFFTFYYDMFDEEEVAAFVARQSEEVRTMLKLIVCVEIESKGKPFPVPILTKPFGLPVPQIDTASPFEKCARFAALVGQMRGEEVLEAIDKDPYLFILALSEGLKNRRTDFNILTRHKFSEVYNIHQRLSQMLFAINASSDSSCIAFADDIFVGYNVMRAFPPESIGEIEEGIVRDVYNFSRLSNMQFHDVMKVCTRWSFYFRHFGTKAVMDLIFRYLWRREADSPINQFVYYLCIGGIVMTIASRKSGFAREFLSEIIQLFAEKVEANQEMSARLFAFVFLSLNESDARVVLRSVRELEESVVGEGEGEGDGCSHSRFVLTFFKFLMHFPKTFKMLKEEMFRVFMKTGDSIALIDYFALYE